ncbi:hypothetical protein [uncultured Mediterranean phage uvMED]|nr:hypothetical protein [uncultured Mediterranean phage uvMED]
MTINSTTRKTNNLVGNGNTATYPFAFKVFTDADIVVKKLEVSTSVETLLTLGATNDYTVSLNPDQNGNPGGSVTLRQSNSNFNLPSGFQLVVTSALEPLQGTDLTNQGGFYPEVINDALDKSVILHQQQQDELDRSIKFSLTNTIGSLEITENATARANKVMAFDNAGEFSILSELGTYRGNWAASRAYFVRDLVKDTSTNNIFMCNSGHTSSGSQPLTTNTDSAKWDLIVDAATATTSSTNAASSATAAASSATAAASSQTAAASSQTAAASSQSAAASSASTASTKASEATTAKTAAETAQAAAETALDSFDDRYLGAKGSNPTLDNDGNALIDGALYFNTTVNRMRVYDLGNTTWLEVTIVGSDLANTNTVAGSISNVNTVAGSISGVNAVANNATNINAVNSNATNINTVASTASNINAVASNASNVNTVASNISNVNAIATDIAKIQTVANDLNETVSEIETAANDLNETTSEIDTVANAITNVDNVGNNIANVNTVAGISSNVTSVAGNSANVNLVAGSITNVNNVGGSIANVNTVASNLSGVNSFAARYRTDNSGNNPSSDLDGGDLFYNQASGKLLVYNSVTSAWEETQSIGNFFINTIGNFSGTGGNSATFNNSAYKFTLSNAGQFAQQMLVSINGVIQKPNTGTGQPSEGFALDGANIVFSSPPASGADYFIITIGASVSIGTPSDNTVTSAKIVDGAIVNADVNASAAIAGSKLADNSISLAKLEHGTSSNNGKFLRANNGADPTFESVITDLVNDTSPQLGGDLDTNSHHILMDDSHPIKFGNGTELEIMHTGSSGYAHTHNSQGNFIIDTTGNFYVRNTTGSETMIQANADGAVELYHDASKKFETTSTGVSVTGTVNSDGLVMGDSEEIQLGNSTDVRLYHDGSNTYFKNLTGDLILNASAIYLNNAAQSATMLRATQGGATTLFHNGGVKFETASYGVQVYGNLEAQGSASGVTSTLQLQPYGATGYINHTGSGTLFIRMGSSYTTRFQLTNDGHFQPNANNAQDLGSTSLRWRNIYTNDLNLSNEGSSNDVDGTWGSYTIQEGAEDLFLVNKRSGKKYKFNLTEVS